VDSPPTGATLASRLDLLFKSVRPRDRGEYTHEEVAQALRTAGGRTISATYIWQLRKGQRDNPTKHHLEALANFFGVPVSYFFDGPDHAKIAQDLEVLAALRDSNVRTVALRAGELNDKGRAAVLALIEALNDTDRAHGVSSKPPQQGP